MALWVEPGCEPTSSQAQADLDAIAALKESAAIELKEKGNEYMKKGKNHFKNAIDCYTRAINQKSMDAVNTAILYANRAQAHLLIGNYRFAILDAQEAIKLNKANLKAYFRGAKAALSLEFLDDASQFCSLGLEQDPGNEELEKLRQSIEKKLSEAAERKRREAIAVAKAKELAAAIGARNVAFGKPLYKELTGGRKPWLDESKLLHWPVLLLYAEFLTSDFIEDFCEVESFAAHLDIIFAEDAPPLPWDSRHDYTRGRIQVFYKACAGRPFSGEQLSEYLLEGCGGKTEHLDLDDYERGFCQAPVVLVGKVTFMALFANENDTNYMKHAAVVFASTFQPDIFGCALSTAPITF